MSSNLTLLKRQNKMPRSMVKCVRMQWLAVAQALTSSTERFNDTNLKQLKEVARDLHYQQIQPLRASKVITMTV